MRISTTTLESFRLFMDPGQEWMTEAALLATIRGEFVPTRPVLIGRAFGAVLENPDAYLVPGFYRCDGVTFEPSVIEAAAAFIDYPRTVFEAKATKRYGRHDVVAKADQLCGTAIVETKTTQSGFDFDKYADSCQWRFMLDIFEATRCTYRVFVIAEDGDGTISLKSVENFTAFPYPDLHRECAALVERFAEFVTRKGLAPLLDARQVEAA